MLSEFFLNRFVSNTLILLLLNNYLLISRMRVSNFNMVRSNKHFRHRASHNGTNVKGRWDSRPETTPSQTRTMSLWHLWCCCHRFRPRYADTRLITRQTKARCYRALGACVSFDTALTWCPPMHWQLSLVAKDSTMLTTRGVQDHVGCTGSRCVFCLSLIHACDTPT